MDVRCKVELREESFDFVKEEKLYDESLEQDFFHEESEVSIKN